MLTDGDTALSEVQLENTLKRTYELYCMCILRVPLILAHRVFPCKHSLPVFFEATYSTHSALRPFWLSMICMCLYLPLPLERPCAPLEPNLACFALCFHANSTRSTNEKRQVSGGGV